MISVSCVENDDGVSVTIRNKLISQSITFKAKEYSPGCVDKLMLNDYGIVICGHLYFDMNTMSMIVGDEDYFIDKCGNTVFTCDSEPYESI